MNHHKHAMASNSANIPTSAVLALSLITVVTLLQSVNGLAHCPQGCDCDDNKLSVVCNDGHLNVVPIALNPSIQRLVIKHDRIKVIDSSIQFYAELSFLDLSYNHLVTIPPKTFGYQRKLLQLYLNHNKIDALGNTTFQGLTSLAILNLRGNFIEELEPATFSPLVYLKELNLGQNRISKLAPNAFAGLNHLRVLHLDDNTLTTVPSSAFQPLRSLTELFLGGNSFTTISYAAFKDLTSLVHLDLSGAGLQNVSSEALEGLDALRVLNLTDNRFRSIPTSEFSNLTTLEELYMGQNYIEAIPRNAFAGLVNLKRLQISSSKLVIIESGAFSINSNLESLDLSTNKKLKEFQAGSFFGLTNLKQLNLSGCSLETFDENQVQWTAPNVLDLTNNPLICDCRLGWLQQLILENSTNKHVPTVECVFPNEQTSVPLKLVKPELLDCTSSNLTKHTMVGVLLMVATATFTALVLTLYKCRRKKGKWVSCTKGSKEREYQKTFTDDDYLGSPHPYNLGVDPHYSGSHDDRHHPPLRPIPVTEL